MIEAFHFNLGKLTQGLSPSEIKNALDDSGSLWINLNGSGDDEIQEILTQVFDFHPWTIEDCRHVSKYPKTDSLANYSFLIFLSPKKSVPVHAKIFMRKLDIYLLPNAIVTHHKEPLQAVQRVRDTLANDGGELLSKGPDFVLHALLDIIIDRYLGSAKAISDRSRALEDLVSRSEANLKTLEEILDLGYSSRALKVLVEQSAVILKDFREQAEHGLFQQASGVYFSDLDDHMTQTSRSLTLSIDRLESARHLFGASEEARRGKWLVLLSGFVLLGIVQLSLQNPWPILATQNFILLFVLVAFYVWAYRGQNSQ
ncbi:MAG: CorA family divalent cation transporter [Planctomycetota bacterium]|nr:CorA family divalent cation transporter [Planctomycetota bacterium]